MPVGVEIDPAPDPASSRPPEPGLGPAVAAWQYTRAQWARDCLAIFALYVGLAGLIALRRWGLGRDLFWLVAFSPVHMLLARRPPLAVGEAWLRVGRRRWVRLDRLRRVSVARRTLTLGDADRRQVTVDLYDLTANPTLGALVLAAVLDSADRGQVALGPVTKAMLGLPIQPRGLRAADRRARRVSRREQRRRRRRRRLGLRHHPDQVLVGGGRTRPALTGRAVMAESRRLVVGVLGVVAAPIIMGWFAWLTFTASSGSPSAARWLAYGAGWLAGGLAIDASFRAHERAEGPMGYAERAGMYRRDPPPAVRTRLVWADRLLLAGMLATFWFAGINDLTMLLWLGSWSGLLVVMIVWCVVRWLPWLRGQPPPAPRH